MLFEIKNAKLSEVRDVTSGTSKSGNSWTKATAIVEIREGAYTDTVPMLVFGDKIQQADDLKGKDVDVKFSVQGREYNGRWYTDLRLQFIAPVVDAQANEKAAPAPEPVKEDDPDADLPF